VTFVFDEELDSVYSKIKPVFDEQGEIACVGIVLDRIAKKGSMTPAQILELQTGGWEIIGHSKTHPDLTALTGEEIEKELNASKDGFTALGYKITNFTYPYYTHNAIARKIARKHYRSARSGAEWITGFDINPHVLRMFALSTVEVERRHHLGILQDYVDRANAENSWLIFTMHNEITKREAVLNLLIDYIQNTGIRIVTMDQALNIIGDKESRLGELLFILNNETPISGNVLRKLHVFSQHLASMMEDNL